MSDEAVIPALVIATVLFAVISYLCWRLSRAALMASKLCRCISEMLNEPARAEPIAAATSDELKQMGLWRS